MRTSSIFQPTDEQIDALVAANPLAQVISRSRQGMLCTPLPLLLDRAEDSLRLIGHFARGNPHVEAIREHPEAIFIFMGPHGYISPSWFTDRSQAPTWNFATVHFEARIELIDTLEEATVAVQRLTSAMEAQRPNAWQTSELGERYARLIKGIVPFRANVLGVTAKFKLGQNERPDVLAEAIAGAERDGLGGLAAMMRDTNSHRGS